MITVHLVSRRITCVLKFGVFTMSGSCSKTLFLFKKIIFSAQFQQLFHLLFGFKSEKTAAVNIMSKSLVVKSFLLLLSQAQSETVEEPE